MEHEKHNYSIVIVTRNRHKALELSLPLILSQSRAPSQVIVVDSSDDHTKSKSVVDNAANRYGFEIEYHSSAPGMTKQRNIGLALVRHEVVVFPDDDSLLFDGAMEEIMKIYDRDKEMLVGGVCSAEATVLPDALAELTKGSYSQNREDRIRKSVVRLRYFLERNIFKNPFIKLGRHKIQSLRSPNWLPDYDAVKVEWQSGFRMSFRTSLIRSIKFDEALGRYAAHEDVDASLGILDSHLLIGARRAQIYHYKSPERRDNGYTMGVILVLNMAYVLAKRSGSKESLKLTFQIFTLYKLFLYLGGSNSKFGRERLKGAFEALKVSSRLFKADRANLEVVYLQIREELGISE